MSNDITPALQRGIKAAHEALDLADRLPWESVLQDTRESMARDLRVPLAAVLRLDDMARVGHEHARCTVVLSDDGDTMTCGMRIPPAPADAPFRTTHMMDALRVTILGSDQ